jgi:hypothetical protein
MVLRPFGNFRNLEISALPPTQSSFRCFENSKGRGKNRARVRARSLGGIEMKSAEDLDVFKPAHQLALKTYSTTKVFPSAEMFSLVDQMRRQQP